MIVTNNKNLLTNPINGGTPAKESNVSIVITVKNEYVLISFKSLKVCNMFLLKKKKILKIDIKRIKYNIIFVQIIPKP